MNQSNFIFFIYIFHFESHMGKPHLLSWSLVTWVWGHPQDTLQKDSLILYFFPPLFESNTISFGLLPI